MKDKIVFLINSLEMGGAERVVINVAGALSKDYDITILTLKNSKFYDSKVKNVSLSNTRSNFMMFILFPLICYRFLRFLKKEKPKKVISFLEISNFVNILFNKNATISFRISLDFFKGFKGGIYKLLIKKLYPKSETIIVNSKENLFKVHAELKVPLSKIKVICNPIYLQSAKKITDKQERKEEKNLEKLLFKKKVFLSVGRLTEQKKWIELITSFGKAASHNKNIVLIILGDGSMKNKLQTLIGDLKLSKNILLLGSKKNISFYLKKADYFVFFSYVEGFPNVLLEAMNANLPIITNDFKTGAKEIIDPELDFNKKISYPYYGPNGILLSFEHFENDFIKFINSQSSIKQNKCGINNYQMNHVVSEWKKFLKSKE